MASDKASVSAAPAAAGLAAEPGAAPAKALRYGKLRRDAWEAKFFEDFKAWGSKSRAAKVAGVSLETVRRHIKDDAVFAEQVAAAHDEFIESLETGLVELFRTKNNFLALIARLKAERPTKYTDKAQLEATVRHSGGVVVATLDQAQALLRDMLSEATDATRERLSVGSGESDGSRALVRNTTTELVPAALPGAAPAAAADVLDLGSGV